MLISNVIYVAGSFLGFFFLSEASNVLTVASLFFRELVVFYLILAVLFFTVHIGSMHLAVLIVKGNDKFNQTFKVICYSFSPINFAWLFVVIMTAAASLKSFAALLVAILPMLGLFASVLYIFYILVVGISVTSEISGGRAFAALMIQLFIYAFISMVLVIGTVLLYQYSITTTASYSPTPYPTPYSTPHITPSYENYTTPNPEKYRITTYAGSPPQIDGTVTEEDKWYEGEKISIESKGKYYAITTKHDFEYIYILMEWSAYPARGENITIRFEQDGSKPDFNLSNGRVDSFYQRSHSAISAANIDDKRTLEWKIPMYSENKYDIHIDRYPTELGFSIIDLADMESGGIFPPDANNHDPWTWGTMTIIDKRRQ